MEIPVYKPDITGNEKKYLIDCIKSGWISSKGQYIEKFENEFKKFTNSSFCTSVSNGTVAIHLALLSLNISTGDEVIVPTLTYVASVNPIVYAGAKPVFVDSLNSTWQMDPEDIKRKINERTKAIIVVHLYGHAADMDSIMTLAKKHNLFVIEDCAEAIGTLYKEKHVGTFGDVGTFSFYANKTITCGEGGMVITNEFSLHERIKKLKNQGVSKEKEYWHDIIGFNYRMTNLQAAIGLAQIERANKFITRKREIAACYKKFLSGLPIIVHDEAPGTFHSYWMTSILVKNKSEREALRSFLKSKGIETRPVFYPVHMMQIHRVNESFPIAENISLRGINLPSWPGLSDNSIKFICNKIYEFFGKKGKL